MRESSAVDRARARARWPVERFELGREPDDDLSATTTIEERIAMMRPLAEAAWAIAGLPLPKYDRAHMPARLVRPALPRETGNGSQTEG